MKKLSYKIYILTYMQQHQICGTHYTSDYITREERDGIRAAHEGNAEQETQPKAILAGTGCLPKHSILLFSA